ncbi:MAG: o-succinylbenzoate synthase, partial [Flavobacteriaceae bacterium]|nr:o-succinylbenzoate synthase [Flavobacteriaceae bacterium]
GRQGVGECGMFRGLSFDDVPNYEGKLDWTCKNINLGLDKLLEQLELYPSIQFGLEMAFRSLESSNPFLLFPSDFTNGVDSIPINGLVWMGSFDFMNQQIKEKIEKGFNCIKMKIGAIDFEQELQLLKKIRREYSPDEIELRVDANGAFDEKSAIEKLNRLSEMKLHSIEQPIKPGKYDEMAKLCEASPLPIALDEDLIGITSVTDKQKLIQIVRPHYIILKPTLIGGYKGSEEWISEAETENIGWWVTSALESNIGLNAISQWTYTLNPSMPQGLGTGELFTNNIGSPLKVKNGTLAYEQQLDWNFKL